MSPFISWINDPRPDRGVRLADEQGGWEFRSWRDLAGSARRVAAGLIAAGVRPGDVVCLVLPTGYPCLTAIFGAWAAGATIAPLVPPSFEPEDEYVEHVAAIFRQARPALVATVREHDTLVGRAMKEAGLPGEPWAVLEAEGEAELQPTGEIALLQFTSGSTGEPRGVRVSWDNLEIHIEVMKTLVAWEEGDAFASWLPLYHDMGLIGGLFLMTVTQGDLWLMRPDQFIRDPLRWLACFDRGKARITASPSFSYAYLARKLQPAALDGLDLSDWRTAVVGAEAVDAAALDSFALFAESAGFSRRTYVPAYGLAENTLAVTATRPEDIPRIVRPDWPSLRFGEPVQIKDAAVLGEVRDLTGAGWIIGHGVPEEGVGLRVIGEDGDPLPDGHLGELVVSGPSVADGYHLGREGKSTRFLDGDLYTGDAGFHYEGDFYVLGRMGDSLKLQGRNVFVEDLDAKVAAATGLGRGRVAVVSMFGSGRAGVALFAEADPGDWVEEAVRTLRRELGPEPALQIVAGPRGLVQRTSSGKTRRRRMWQQLQGGHLEGATIVA